MNDTFVTTQDFIEQWGFSGSDDPNGPISAVMTFLKKIKAPALRGHPSKRGVLGLTGKQFEKASALRAAFNKADAAKPAKPAKRRPVTAAEFKKIKADAVANGFMDLRVIGKAWGMKWPKTLEYMHFLDPTVKDTAQLIQGSIERMNIPQSERRGLYREEFDRLTAIGKQRLADQEADQAGAPRLEVDAEVPNAYGPRTSATSRPRIDSLQGVGRQGSRLRKPSSTKNGLSITPKSKPQGTIGTP